MDVYARKDVENPTEHPDNRDAADYLAAVACSSREFDRLAAMGQGSQGSGAFHPFFVLCESVLDGLLTFPLRRLGVGMDWVMLRKKKKKRKEILRMDMSRNVILMVLLNLLVT